MSKLGEFLLDLSIDWDFDLECDREFLIGDGERFSSNDEESDIFFSSKGDLDLLRDFRFGLFDGDRDKISGDFCEFDRERDLIATFGDAEGEWEFDRECGLNDEGDLEQEREFTFGEEHLDGGLLRLVEVDLDLDREFSRDAKLKLFLDSEELLDLDLDLDRDLLEHGEPPGDCDSLWTIFPSISGDGDLDLEGDLEVLFLPPDFELDLDDLWFLIEEGDIDRFLEGEREGDLEYDFRELAFDSTEAGDLACTGDEWLDLGEGLIEFDFDLLLTDLWESSDGLLDFSCSSSDSLLSSRFIALIYKIQLYLLKIIIRYFFF